MPSTAHELELTETVSKSFEPEGSTECKSSSTDAKPFTLDTSNLVIGARISDDPTVSPRSEMESVPTAPGLLTPHVEFKPSFPQAVGTQQTSMSSDELEVRFSGSSADTTTHSIEPSVLQVAETSPQPTMTIIDTKGPKPKVDLLQPCLNVAIEGSSIVTESKNPELESNANLGKGRSPLVNAQHYPEAPNNVTQSDSNAQVPTSVIKFQSPAHAILHPINTANAANLDVGSIESLSLYHNHPGQTHKPHRYLTSIFTITVILAVCSLYTIVCNILL